MFPNASHLGFGCAALGSRVGRGEGLRALARAHDLGINWFDIAPSYGDGEAELILSEFVKGRRGNIHICTKCGVLPGKVGRLRRLVKPLVRRAVKVAPQLRKVASRGRESARTIRVTERLFREGLDLSLKRLGTDYIEVYALHDPDPDALDRDEIQRAMHDVLACGKVRAIGIAGSFEAALAALTAKAPVSFVQLADPPFEGVVERLRAIVGDNWPPVLSTHSIFGRPDIIRSLCARAGSKVRLQELLAAQGYMMPFESAARAALLDYALARNCSGIVLVSMFSARHLERNAASLKGRQFSRAQDLFAMLSAAVATVDQHA